MGFTVLKDCCRNTVTCEKCRKQSYLLNDIQVGTEYTENLAFGIEGKASSIRTYQH